MNILFSKNSYDSDGDVIENGIFLHIDETTIIKLRDLSELKEVIEQLTNIYNEISYNPFNPDNEQKTIDN